MEVVLELALAFAAAAPTGRSLEHGSELNSNSSRPRESWSAVLKNLVRLCDCVTTGL